MWNVCGLLCKKNVQLLLQFDRGNWPRPTPTCTNIEFLGNLCEAPYYTNFTYWNFVFVQLQSSAKSLDWDHLLCDCPVQKKLRAHWNLTLTTRRAQWPVEKTMNSKETCGKHHFLPNKPIEILFAPFERSLSNLQTEMIHFMIGLSKKIWGPIEIWSWPPGVLNDPLKKQWIQRKLVRSTYFYQIGLLKFCLHHLKDLYQIYRLKLSILW